MQGMRPVLLKGIVHREDQTSAGNGKQELVSANMHLYNTHKFFQIIIKHRRFQNCVSAFSY